MEVGEGKEAFFKDHVNQIYKKKSTYNCSQYDEILDVPWPVPRDCFDNLPSSKPTQFLVNVLGMPPIEKLYYGYDVKITDQELNLANEYADKIDRPFVILHYLAKTLKFNKSLGHEEAAFICWQILKGGCIPLILDWKNESPLPDGKFILNPGADHPIWGGQRLASAGTIAALISRAKLYVGIDSGPLHVAACTKTPAVGVWHGHHPVNFFDLADNVTHLVKKSKKCIKGLNKNRAKTYFESKYKHLYYDNLPLELASFIRTALT